MDTDKLVDIDTVELRSIDFGEALRSYPVESIYRDWNVTRYNKIRSALLKSKEWGVEKDQVIMVGPLGRALLTVMESKNVLVEFLAYQDIEVSKYFDQNVKTGKIYTFVETLVSIEKIRAFLLRSKHKRGDFQKIYEGRPDLEG